MILKRDIKSNTMSQTDPTFQMGVDPWPGGTSEPPLLGDFNFGQENNNCSFSSPCYADTALRFSDVCSPVSSCSSSQTHEGEAIKTEPDIWMAENAMMAVMGQDFNNVQAELMDRPNWSNQDLELLKIEDIFQVDPSDLIQTPTLAELNSVDESMTELFACKKDEPVIKPDEITSKPFDKLDQALSNLRESRQTIIYPNHVSGQLTMMPTAADAPKQDLLAKNPGLRALLTQSSSSYQAPAVSQTAVAASKSSTLGSSLESGDQILASQKDSSSHLFTSHQALPSCSAQVQSIVPVKKEPISQVPVVLPSVLPKNQKWDKFNALKGTECKQAECPGQPFSETERRWEEIVDYIHKKDDDGAPLTKRAKVDQVFAQKQIVSSKSLAKQDVTKDEDALESDDPVGSDVDADLGKMDFLLTDDSDSESETFLKPPSCRRKQRFFWEYNLQAKGQKGEKLHVLDDTMDPHILGKASDPVFLPDIHISGIKHSGKARKGDGNDLTPNPRKLYNIGQELKHLSRTINNMVPVSEVPATVRIKSRREKNKLASRACRLKKKAHHESNKLKLFGLEREHEALMKTLTQIKKEMLERIQHPNAKYSETLCEYSDQLTKETLHGVMVGDSAEFIVEILQNIVKGHPTGGLQL